MIKINLLLISICFFVEINVRAETDSKNINISQNSSQKQKLYEQKITKVAKELQDVLATKMLEQMFEARKPDKRFGGGSAENTYNSLLNEERAKNLDLGLVEHIKQQMKKNGRSVGRKDNVFRKK